MRELDRLTTERYGVPSLLLMEAAANAAARAISLRFPHGIQGLRAIILCGGGNNGGDGAALARSLRLGGARVEVILFSPLEETRGDARINFEIVCGLANSEVAADGTEPSGRLLFTECASEAAWAEPSGRLLESYDVIVDALFGTGLSRPLAGIYASVIDCVARTRERRTGGGSPAPLIVALDLPSGLNADLAQPIGPALHADLTVTFTAPKPANVLPPASLSNGELVVADIGTPSKLLAESPSQLFLTEAADARAWLRRTRYAPDSYKNTHGHALVVAGSRQMSGAAVLAAEGAMRAGAGLVTVATPSSALPAVAARSMPEVMTAALPEIEAGAASDQAAQVVRELTARADVVAIGPGLTAADERTRRFVRGVVERRNTPVVIDADGLNALAPWPRELQGTPERPLVLTPHPGEMRRLIGAGPEDGEALADRVQVARDFAVEHRCILVLKGTRTLVAAPDGRVFVNPTGNAGLGTAGAGDTLTGIITGCLAQSYGTLKHRADALAAVVAAVYLGGLAGDIAARERGMRTLLASDVREHLGAAVRALDPEGERP